MTRRRDLARDALRKATRLRREVGLRPDAPVCVYDLAEGMGVEVRFLDVPSLEGMYSKTPEPVIVLSSLRPPGRQAFTCGHELGHHVYDHGLRVDELFQGSRSDPAGDEEFLVQCFSGFLLMPKAAVVRAFKQRGWDIERPTPEQIFVISGWLGVGYETLVFHLRAVLGMIGEPQSKALCKVTPKSIRRDLLGEEDPDRLVVVDEFWEGQAVDLRVGDAILAMPGVRAESDHLEELGLFGGSSQFRATKPGTSRLVHAESGWSSFVRVSRRGYVGRAIFRFQEEVPDGNEALLRERAESVDRLVEGL